MLQRKKDKDDALKQADGKEKIHNANNKISVELIEHA